MQTNALCKGNDYAILNAPLPPAGRPVIRLRNITKTLLVMKLTVLFLVISMMTASARGFSQGISISGKNIPIEKAFQTIESQTDFTFYYKIEILQNLKVSVNLKNARLETALAELLKDQPLTYHIIDKNIVVNLKQRGAPTTTPELPSIPFAIIITGRVTSEDNTPLHGVSITIKGTDAGTTTDEFGTYRISVPSEESILVYSMVGYTQQETKVGKRTSIPIKLKVSDKEMDRVVVIGYGESRKGDLTGSVAQADVKEMSKAPVPTFDQALAGRIAGVQVSGNDGQPGVANTLVIRGNNSLTQSNEPLYVIDGYPIESFEDLPISPSDIESIQVLKDASATSIYGSRGANGVVIITTKKGVAGKPAISVNTYYGVQKVAKRMEMMSPYEFVKYENELNPATTERIYLQERTLEDYKNIKGYNLQNELFQSAPIFNADIGFRGGNDGTQYSVFTNILRSEGVIINSGYNRLQGKFSLSQQLSKNIKGYINTTFTKSKTDGSIISENTGGIASLSKIYSTLGYRPVNGTEDGPDLTEEFYDPVVLDETPTDYRVNPVISSRNEINSRILTSTVINGYFDFKLSKNLLLKIRGGLTENSMNRESFYNSKTQKGNPNYPTSQGTTGAVSELKTQNWLNENTLSYTTKINKHKINALAGFTMQENRLFYSGFEASFIEDESMGIDGIDLSATLTPTVYKKEWGLASFLGRVNYTYKDKFLLTASFRTDGSSKFRGENQWGYFPSGAFAWVVTKEKFMKKIRPISDLKFRVSYGTTGNNRVDEYATYSGVIFPFTAHYSFNNGTPIRGASLRTSAGTTDLRWETTTQFNTGIDLNLLNDRINFVFDYYNKTTDDLLLNANLPYTSGYLNAFQNIGSVRNQGLEFTLQTQNIKRKNFTWNTSFNISFNKNKVLKLQGDQAYRLSTVPFAGGFTNIAPYIAKVGEPMGLMYGAVADGLYQYSDFDQLPNGTYVLKDGIPDNGRTRNTIQPGDMKFIDQNNDGTINSEDYTVIGNGNPLHIGGMLNNFTFGDFDLSIFLQWSYGNDIVNANKLYFEENTLQLYNFNLYASAANRWTPENQNTNIPRARHVSPSIYHSNIIEDGSYLRFKTISLGYQLPAKLIRRVNMKAARAYLSVQNLLTITGYSGVDPEVSTRNSALTPGFDWSAYPRARTVTVGLNVSF